MTDVAQYSQVLSSVAFPPQVEFVSLVGNRLTLRMVAEMDTPSRGHLLLELEKRLHREIDPEIGVFLQPRGDENKLRIKLRGIQIK